MTLLKPVGSVGPVGARETNRPALVIDLEPAALASCGVRVLPLDREMMRAIHDYLAAGDRLESILRVSVDQTGTGNDEGVPDVLGRYHVLEKEIRFVPLFPFERGTSYRANFDPRPCGGLELPHVLTLDFSLPLRPRGLPARVTHIFPSADRLPENLLRLYVCFSRPMQRGRAGSEISLLGPDGEPAPNVLYRAPVELWDAGMQRLTMLLDPGRLKRGVGPNRELGPPLEAGRAYSLAVGKGMTDMFGDPLSGPVHKRFQVIEALREAIAVDQWTMVQPMIGTRDPLLLGFPAPLDWALLSNSIGVASTSRGSISGRVEIDRCEQRWRFIPGSAWTAGSYQIRLAPGLEDVCGNTVAAAFDGPLRSAFDMADDAKSRSVAFTLT